MRFQAFSPEHWLLLGLFALGIVVVVLAGHRIAGTPREQPVRRTAAVVMAVVALWMQAYQLTPGDYDLDTSWPLQLCDLATWAAVYALWTRSPRASAFVYYVGLTLTIQGIITPSLYQRFPDPRYVGFWLLHFGVVWAAVLLTWGLRIRPTWAGYRFACCLTAGWALVAYALNRILGTNYGYLLGKPRSASALDLLGPWPLYVLVEIVLILVVWAALLTWPWTRRTQKPLAIAKVESTH